MFKALLSPHFREGTELRSTGAVEILLPEDDAAAMETICCVLHFCYEHISFEPPQGQLGRIAITAEKYDLAKALEPIAHVWISRVRQNSNREQWETLLIIAYLLQQEELFESIGEDIVWRSESKMPDTDFDDIANEAVHFKEVFSMRP